MSGCKRENVQLWIVQYNHSMRPDDSLSKHFRLTPLQERALRKLGIGSVRDILYHLPSRYDQSGSEEQIAGLAPGQEATIFGTIKKLETRRSWKRKIPIGEAVIEDGSGKIKVMWFHQPYLAKKFSEGAFVKAVGQVGGTDGKLYLANPHVEVADPTDAGIFANGKTKQKTKSEFFAVYPESRGVTSLWFRHAIERVLRSNILDSMEDPIPPKILARYHLPEVRTALRYVHVPEDLRHAEAARKRFSFEEIFSIQVSRALERAQNDAQPSFPIKNAEVAAKTFLGTIPFPPTSAQQRAIRDMCGDFEGGHPMARLLEGDVGSGKTLVAATTSYAVVTSRPEGAPLGRQPRNRNAPGRLHGSDRDTRATAFRIVHRIFQGAADTDRSYHRVGLQEVPFENLAKAMRPTISRAQLLKWVANGEIAMLIGTHALIQKSVKFQHLAYAIVDEQHRFGTRQRRALAHKGDATPHFLSMTATPIPRTLALTIYGDLDISVLDELPPGRAKIKTTIVRPKDRASAYEAVREELKKGRQAYVICPRIEEPDPANQNALQAKSAKAESARLKKEVFPEFEIGLLHGAMKPAGKRRGDARILRMGK